MSEQQSELAEAIENVIKNPSKAELWDQVEELAGQLDDPESVAAAYRSCLQQEIGSEEAVELGQRAVHFHQEWFGDEGSGLSDLLSRVLQLSPANEWAFHELTAALTVAERWDDAIKLYQDVIARTSDKPRLIVLLNEAYQVAKDLANRPDDAIDFLKAKLDLAPSDKQLVALERLLERHERWTDLIELWRDAMSSQDDTARLETLTRIATVYFDKLSSGQDALHALREIFSETQHPDVSLSLLERIATSDAIDASLRESTLATVREVYEACERPGDVVRVLADALPLSTEAQRKGLHAELGERLSALEEHAAALDHYTALLILDPASVATQRALRREAQLTDRLDRFASALAAAADTSSDPSRRVALLTEAAVTLLDLPEGESDAIDLLSSALATEGIRPADVLNVGKRLNLLLSRAERNSERLSVLEQLANAESVESSRRALIGDVAALAEQLGETDRALAAWRRRIEANPADLRALERLIDLLLSEKRWPELIDALSARRTQAVPKNQERSDLTQIARIYEEELEQDEQALAAWTEVRERYGEDPETIAALTRLMTSLEHWADLANLLEGSNAQQVAYLADQFASLGNAYRQSLGDDRKAIECYRRALTVDVGHSGAQEGLKGLLEDPSLRNEVAEALVHSLRSSGNLVGLLDIVDARIAGTQDVRKHAEILREAADIAQGDPERVESALDFVTRLFALTPRDRVLEDRMQGLARTCEDWDSALQSYAKAQEAIVEDAFAFAAMQWRLALVHREDREDLASALSCVLQVISIQPDNHEAVSAAIDLASREGNISTMVSAMLGYASARQTVPQEFVASIEAFVGQAEGGYEKLCTSIIEQLQESALAASYQAEFHSMVANWYLDKVGDETSALQSLLWSTQLDQSQVATYKRLASLQRSNGDEGLYATVRRLCEIDSGELGYFREAAQISMESLGMEQQRESLSALQGRAIGAWRGSAPAESNTPAEEIVAWTIEQLVAHYVEENQAQRALDVLIDASRLPFEQATCLSMRKRAAAIASDVLKDPASAIDMLRAVLAQAPSDAEALDALGLLYREQGRLPELLGLMRQGLKLEEDVNRAIAMRLEIASLIDLIDRSGGRRELLCENLSLVPGHQETISALIELLRGMGKFSDLCNLLGEQAQGLENASDIPRAAQMWNQVAQVAELELDDVDQALKAYRRVANLAPNLEALDSLARLYINRSQSSAAVPWLEQALDLASPGDKPTLVRRLAQAHLAAKHIPDAIACLSSATSDCEDPVLELRTMLATLHREAQEWQELADTLTAMLPHIDDRETLADTACEAASLYHEKLSAPAQAVPALAQALQLVPEDKSLRLMMARSQRCAGNPEPAREILEALIGEYGRRRSKERAAVHAELALVARAQSDLDTAMAELELASKMDNSNAHILRSLADLARERGDFEQAERSLRALLLIVRRDPPGEDETAVGISEVLFELQHIAAERENEEKSEELLESVIEAAAASDAEVRRLRRTLNKHMEFDLLAKVLRTRIALSEETASKAKLLGILADLLEGALDDPEAALDIRLQCLSLLPQDGDLHEKAKHLAMSLSQLPRYLTTLGEMITQQRRSEDASLTTELLMRAGSLAEHDLNDLACAREHYAAAQECSSAPAEALFAIARVCAAQGNTEAQEEALDKLTAIAMADGPLAAQADALYRLSELQVAQADLLERGMGLLSKALEVEPRYRQAALILQSAAQSSGNDALVLERYESIARQSGDKPILLDFLERQAAGELATLSQIHEAVQLAKELQESERVSVLLERAVAVARNSDDGLSAAVWAAVALARHYGATSRVSQAKDLLLEIAYLASSEEIMELGLELSTQSQAEGSPALTCEILEFLRERDPTVRSVWEPLLALYGDSGNGERISALVDETLPGLVSAGERTWLRLHKAQYLVDSNLDEEAIIVLRDACLDDPDSLEAAALLETVLRKEGNEEALGDFLWQRFNDAVDRGNPETISDVAVRLGTLLDQVQGDSMAVYQQALIAAPSSPDLLRGIIERLGDNADIAEQADLSERLLRVESPESSAALTLALVELREVLEDEDGIQRALELGNHACPMQADIRERLQTLYKEGEKWAPLAQMKINQAEAEEESAAQVTLLREAAVLYRESLSDLHTTAAVLGRAVEIEPTNVSLLCDLATAQSDSGRTEEGIKTLGAGLDLAGEGESLAILLLRAELYCSLGKNSEALDDLEAGLSLAPEVVEPKLMEVLEETRVAACGAGDQETERRTTTRIIDLFDNRGDQEGARSMLLMWVERDSQDVPMLQRLRDMERAAERWEGVITACRPLVSLETGEEQVSTALLLAEAAEQEGEIEQGQLGLERVHQDQPECAPVRERLRAIYKAGAEHRKLANLLLSDANYSDNDDERYEIFRSAASIFVNELEDADAAIEPAQKAKELRPDDHATVALLADVLIASKQLEEAIAMLEPAIASHKRRSPELAALQYRMSKVGAAQGNQEEQLAWLKKAFDVDRKDGLIASELAHLATEMEDYDLALKPLRAITLMEDPEPVSRVMALLWEAKIEHARGNRAKAELWAKKALREDPNYSEAQDFLVQISE